MRINHNIAALNTYRQLTANNGAGAKSLEKLSSGLRINRAGDDAAGLAISEKMRGQIRGLEQASRNAQDGISLIQTAEGALNETHSILQRMRELAVQSSNDTNTETDRKELQKEVDQLAKELTRIGNNTEFNTQKLVNGGFKGTFHIGANENQDLELGINAMDAFSLGVTDDVKSVNATSADATKILGADIDGDAYFTEGTYTVELDSAGTTAYLKDAEGNQLASTTTTATTAETVTFDASASGLGQLTINKSATFVAGESVDIAIGANGSDLSETTNTANLDAVQMSKTDALAEGTYTIKYDGTASSEKFDLLDKDGNVLASATGAAAANTNASFTLANGETVTFTQSTTAATDGQTSEFTVTKSDYTSGLSSAATDTDADGNLDKDAIVVKGIDISTQSNANSAITKLNESIETVSAERSKLGAYQNRLEHTINNLGTSAENLTAAESRIRDVDMAKEMMEFTKTNILSQAAQAMLAQANQQPQGVLQLLR
ncbi:MAG: flagellin [Firmicutes bacterium]|nr:flagellin [Bacillota bacterium]